jgi:hypothetical protein
MSYFIKCDSQKVPKEGIVGIMGVKGATFHFFMFCFFFGVCFCCLQLMSFGLYSSWNAGALLMNWCWSLVPRILFDCKDEDEAKRLAMCLVVEEDKYLKAEKAKHSWFSNFLFDFVFFCFAVVSVGKNAQTQLCSYFAFLTSKTPLH